MKQIKNILVLALLIVSISMPIARAEEYRLAAGDILTIGVWGYEDLAAKEVMIRPDGKIAFPLVGEVQAAGNSAAELTSLLTAGLGEYVKSPHVTINIFKFHTTRVYVLGMVNKPGLYELEKQHNLLDAIGIAGSYTKEAAKRRVTIIRKNQEKNPIKVNLMDIWEKGDMRQNYVLGDGDVVYLADNGQINIPNIMSAAYQLAAIKNYSNDD